MKKFNNRTTYRGIALCMLASVVLGGCNKFETRDFSADKPQSIIDQESLDSLKELKTYVNYSNQPNFKLGAELSLSDVQKNSLLYRLVQKHFDGISFTGLSYMDFVATDGSLNLANFKSAVDADSVGMPLYAGHLVTHEKQQGGYLRGLIADIIIPGESGSDLVEDFEDDAIGKTFPTTTNAASATVVADPDKKSGNALRILKTTDRAYPQFTVTLPSGKTLGDYKSVSIDFKGGGCCGLYGGGMQLGISTALGSGVTLKGYGGPSSFGVGDNVWGRGLIVLPLATLNLTTEQKALSTFVLSIGSNTGSADYLIDNVKMNWEKIGSTIVKSPEEKAEIISGELRKWIKGVAEIGKDKVQAWSVVYQPMDETNTSKLRTGVGTTVPVNTFYWQDYLGKDYAAIAIGMLKQYANADDKVFFTETNLMDNPSKIQGLADFIAYTETKGQKVDGIATELALNISSDKGKIEAMLQALANTGKLVKIAALDIGVGVETSLTTATLYQQQADMYKWFVQTYFSKVPAAQRAGITFRSPIDQSSSSTWRKNEPVGLWTGTTSYLRKPAYLGVVEALKGN